MDFKGLKVHFIGIGGIGISALARLLKTQGAIISGSDIYETTIIKDLKNEGAKINIPHDKSNIATQDIIIHSAIIKDDNIEIIESKRLNKRILSRKEAIKLLLSTKNVLSVCAAHGKSTTSAILSSILPDANALIGAISKEFDSNVKVTNSDLLVFEADESDKSFLNSNPYKSIVINIEAEHLESYDNDYDKLKKSYIDFINLSKKGSILNLECPMLRDIKSQIKVPFEALMPSKDISNISYILKDNKPFMKFDLLNYGSFEVFGIGEHFAINTSMAILCAKEFLDIESIRKNLLNFCGIKKRFDILQYLKVEKNHILEPCIIDDYAHHPTEIRATLQACNIYTNMLKEHFKLQNLKTIAIWQPHKYTRLRDNLQDFIACFKNCDRLIIMPVYAASEKKIDFDFENLFGKYNPTFVSKIKRNGANIDLINDDNEVFETLDGDVIIGLGAGDITYQLRCS